jgi:hypothetical protein
MALASASVTMNMPMTMGTYAATGKSRCSDIKDTLLGERCVCLAWQIVLQNA